MNKQDQKGKDAEEIHDLVRVLTDKLIEFRGKYDFGMNDEVSEYFFLREEKYIQEHSTADDPYIDGATDGFDAILRHLRLVLIDAEKEQKKSQKSKGKHERKH